MSEEMSLSPECFIIASNLNRKENDPNGSPALKTRIDKKKSNVKCLRLRFTSSAEKEVGTQQTIDDLILSFVTPKHLVKEPKTAK